MRSRCCSMILKGFFQEGHGRKLMTLSVSTIRNVPRDSLTECLQSTLKAKKPATKSSNISPRKTPERPTPGNNDYKSIFPGTPIYLPTEIYLKPFFFISFGSNIFLPSTTQAIFIFDFIFSKSTVLNSGHSVTTTKQSAFFTESSKLSS